jgi:hypothetical protein
MNTRTKLSLAVLASAMAAAPVVDAYIVNIAATNPRMIYLRVGDGVMSGGTYSSGGTPARGGAIPLIRAVVPASAVGNGVPQVMTTPNNPRLTSDLDGFLFCNSGQVYVGGFYRTTATNGANSQPARLVVSAPANLTNAGGQTIPISQISWTSSGNGDTGVQPIPAGTFVAGQSELTTFPRNTWRESCLTFRYGNQNLVAAGTYEATVTFTLAQP